MVEVKSGRQSFLAASTLLDAAIKDAPRPLARTSALTWAREQLRLQAIQHIRSLAGKPERNFMRQALEAIRALDEVLGQPADTELQEGKTQ